jgi:phage shock protein PspC (stress-responsive transcriptional regulator)
MLGGVCGGLGRYFDVNPVLYRVGFVVLALLGGAGVLIYGACLLVIPNEGERESIASEALRNHRQRPAALVGLALVAFAGIVLLSNVSFHFDNDGLWLIALVVGGTILWSQRRRDRLPGPPADPAAPVESPSPVYQPALPARRASMFPLGFGILVVAGGVLGLLEASGVDVPWAIALAAAAVALGVAVVLGAVNRQRVGGLAIVGILLAVAAIAASSIQLHLDDGIGDRTYRPLAVDSIRNDYRLGIGELEVDLGTLELPAGQTRVEAHLGIGHLRVIVPPGVKVRASGHVKWGEAVLLGHNENGHDVSNEVGRSSAQLVIDAHVGAGQIEVVRAVR